MVPRGGLRVVGSRTKSARGVARLLDPGTISRVKSILLRKAIQKPFAVKR
jgi:hypothetical protein